MITIQLVISSLIIAILVSLSPLIIVFILIAVDAACARPVSTSIGTVISRSPKPNLVNVLVDDEIVTARARDDLWILASPGKTVAVSMMVRPIFKKKITWTVECIVRKPVSQE